MVCTKFINFIYNRAKITFKNYGELRSMFEKGDLMEPDFNGGIQVLHDSLPIQTLLTNGSILKRILKEQFRVQMFSFRQKKNYMIDVLNDKLAQLAESGIIEFFERDREDLLNIKRYEHLNYDGPKVLTLKHLEAGFVVWLVTVSFTFIIFAFEWLVTFLNFLALSHIFKAFYQLREQDSRRACHLNRAVALEPFVDEPKSATIYEI